MYKPVLLFVSAFALLFNSAQAQTKQKPASVDICVYGGTSAGVIAAYTAAKMNKSVVLIEPGNRLGGLSTGGLGFSELVRIFNPGLYSMGICNPRDLNPAFADCKSASVSVRD